MALVELTENNIKKIQIDEGIVVIDLGETSEKVLGPTRGGAEVTITPTIRDIEYDGRRGKTKGLQVKDGEDVSCKIITLDCSQETLLLAIPNAEITASDSTKKIEQGDFGVIKDSSYAKNLAVITKTLDGKFKVVKIKNPMHEGAFGFKAVQKAENEHNLELLGHYNYADSDEKIWSIEDADTNPIASS